MLPLGADKAKLNVGIDGVVEERRLLLDEADLSSPPLQVNLPQGSPADGDGAVAPEQAL
jgi:hypothetical protein